MGERREKIIGIRKRVGDLTKQSSLNYPQVPAFYDIDMSRILDLKDRLEADGIKIAMSAMIGKLVSTALKDYPRLNSRVEDNEIVYYDEINCGFAIDVGQGLMIVVVKDMANKSIVEISDEFKALVKRCQNRQLTREDISGGTFTLTSFSSSTMRAFISILSNDECITVGTGGIYKRPTVDENDQIVVRPMCTFTSNMNHIIADGLENSNFVAHIQEIAKNPDAYLL